MNITTDSEDYSENGGLQFLAVFHKLEWSLRKLFNTFYVK